MTVNVYVFFNVSEFGHWVCGKSTKNLQPVLSLLFCCSWISSSSFLSVLVCYTCIVHVVYMYMYIHVHVALKQIPQTLWDPGRLLTCASSTLRALRARLAALL